MIAKSRIFERDHYLGRRVNDDKLRTRERHRFYETIHESRNLNPIQSAKRSSHRGIQKPTSK
jgi:hypothetical protein